MGKIINKNFRIRNYETGVSWQVTVGQIEDLLVSFGAEAILKDYMGDGRIAALSFKYKQRGYRLPANSEKISEMLRDYPGYKNTTQQRRDDQAERIAWRNMRDWLEAQVALIRTSQVEVEQIMLPYMCYGEATLYDKLKREGFMLSNYGEPRGVSSTRSITGEEGGE